MKLLSDLNCYHPITISINSETISINAKTVSINAETVSINSETYRWSYNYHRRAVSVIRHFVNSETVETISINSETVETVIGPPQ